MTDFASMTDEELDRAAAIAAAAAGKLCPAYFIPSSGLDDVEWLAEALGIELYGEIAHESGSRRRTYEMTAYRGDIDSSAEAKNPARAATIAILTVDEKRKEQTV